MKRILNTLLFLTFILTLLVPITGVHIHKLASVIFLILCLVHTGVYWKKMNIFRFFVLGLIFEVFLTGLFGMIFKQYPIILSIHTISSIAVVFFLAIHIFVFKKKICYSLRSHVHNANKLKKRNHRKRRKGLKLILDIYKVGWYTVKNLIIY